VTDAGSAELAGRTDAGAAELAAAARVGRRRPSVRAVDLLALVGVLALAAFLRLPDLATRGTFDGDQGTDALVVRTMLREGLLPLLGPLTSGGEFHHGALYYYLMAPSGLASGGDDPLALATLIAVLGVAAVGVTWWLARSIGGPVAGLVAGLLLAVSATAVNGSTFIWNPNPVPFFAAVALAASWRAATGGRARWWLLGGAAQAMVQQLHVLGVLGLVPLGALWLASVHRSPGGRRRLLAVGLGMGGIIALGYVPLLIHELEGGFSETRGMLAWLAGSGGAGGGGSLADRLAFVPLRVISWSLTGPILAALGPAVLAVAGWSAAVTVAALRSRGAERRALAWLGGSVALATVALTLAVRSLAVVTPLPSDHYHVFLTPAITVSAGVAAAVIWRWRPAGGRAHAAALKVAVGLGVGALVTWNLGTQPPRVTPDGGWPAAANAAGAVVAATGGRPTVVVGVPAYKSTAALTYPLTVLGHPPVLPADATRVTVLCDALFEEVVGLACRGPAEEARLAEVGIAAGPLVTRFEAAPGRWISIYEIAGR
jgi:4-amino-4-deoxy-L-arabinose transferase-like glycosyltransferase